MKAIIILSLLLLTTSAFGQVTKEDLRTIVREEVTASEKRVREYIDLKIETTNARIDALEKSVNARIDAVDSRIDALEKSVNGRFDAVDGRFNAVDGRFDAVDKSLDRMWWLMIGFIGLITAAIAVPQIVIAYRDRGQQGMQAEIQQLRETLEALENTPS